MKTIIMAFAILLAGTATFAQAKHSHKHHHSASTQKYTCSMHPEMVMNKPGKCPKCGMALVPMKKKMNKKEMGDMKMDK
ncbi:MAG: hypothetical protein M3004_11900 [Bacteroidota bacterium]|nr:hypothetical protein [Bacteroidota bacterium]